MMLCEVIRTSIFGCSVFLFVLVFIFQLFPMFTLWGININFQEPGTQRCGNFNEVDWL